MKIILSRKGFDGSNGGMPSPILPDGTMLSMPIPDDSGDNSLTFDKLVWNGTKYSDILYQLQGRKKSDYSLLSCHLDPDIRKDIREKTIDDWKPAFGQMESAQGHLANCGVNEGDLFLFFGWFQQTEYDSNGCLRYARSNTDFYKDSELHAVYGYMQVGKIINDPEEIKQYYWHAHALDSKICRTNNTLYIPTEQLSFAPDLPGYGTLNYSKSKVLTLEGKTKGTWINYKFLQPDRIINENRKNSAKGDGLYYAGIWQELVFNANEEMLKWAKQLINS